MPESVIMRRVRSWLVVMVLGLVAAGLTAFPLAAETRWLDGVVAYASWVPDLVTRWIDHVTAGVRETGERYPFMAYGTDWLAYAHLMIAILFVGAIVDPVRNVWVVWFGLISCASIIPLALMAGPVRHIPFWWTCIDMSFGVLGAIPVLFALAGIRRLVAARDREREDALGVVQARRPGRRAVVDERVERVIGEPVRIPDDVAPRDLGVRAVAVVPPNDGGEGGRRRHADGRRAPPRRRSRMRR